MTAWFDNERLSAYLDGELSPQERLSVEKLLASDPAARQLLDELRAQREMIRQLPRVSIPRDLSRSVVALAEQRRRAEMGSRGQDTLASAVEEKREALRPFRALFKRLLHPRNLGWALLAASIGIAISLISPQFGRRAGDVEVAKRDTTEKETRESQERRPSIPVLRAAPSEKAPEAARSQSEPSSMGSSQMAAPAAPSTRMADTVGSARVATQEPLASEKKQGIAPESPQVVIERVVPMMGNQGGGPRIGTTSPADAQVASFEIVCDVAESASLQTLVGRVIRRHQAIPEQAALDAAWEFAANREDHREKAPATEGRAAEESGPDVEVAFEEREGFEEAVIEFSATLAQVQAVLAELGAQSGQVRSISVPRELAGILQENQRVDSDRLAARVGRAEAPGAAGARSLRPGPVMPEQTAPPSAGMPQGFGGGKGAQSTAQQSLQEGMDASATARRQMAPATSAPRDLYRIRVVLRHKRSSEAAPSGGSMSQPQPQGAALPGSPNPQK